MGKGDRPRQNDIPNWVRMELLECSAESFKFKSGLSSYVYVQTDEVRRWCKKNPTHKFSMSSKVKNILI